jgi:hypothetical protein
VRARLRYLTLSPRTPARVAGWAVDLLALLAATATLVAVVTGWASVTIFSVMMDVAATLGVTA